MQTFTDAIDFATDRLSAAYDRVLPNVSLNLHRGDGAFRTYAPELASLTEEMPPDLARQFDKIIDNRVMKRFGKDGVMVR